VRRFTAGQTLSNIDIRDWFVTSDPSVPPEPY